MRMRGRVPAGSLVAVAVAILALAGGGAAQEPQPGGTLRVGLVKLAQIVQDNLKKIGVDMGIALLEIGAWVEKRKAGQFDGAESLWSGRPDPDGNMFSHLTTGGANNWGKYSNSRVDELLRQARSASKPAERKGFYGEAVRLLVDDAPLVFLYHDAWTKGWEERVQGYVEVPDGRMRLERVWLSRR